MSLAALDAGRMRLHNRRKRVNAVALTLSLGAMAFGVFWLLWILWETFRLGMGGLTFSVFTEMTPPPQAEVGGLANAIYGSLMMVTLATAIGTPIGMMAGIYLAEYGKNAWLGRITQFINDILLSAPSIVIGLFVYSVAVAPMKTFSGWAGVLALALATLMREANRSPGMSCSPSPSATRRISGPSEPAVCITSSAARWERSPPKTFITGPIETGALPAPCSAAARKWPATPGSTSPPTSRRRKTGKRRCST